MVIQHECLAGCIHQPGALATERFRQKKSRRVLHVEHGGMKLDELHVGHARSRAVRQSRAVSASDGGVGGLLIHLARATGRQQRRAGAHQSGLAALVDEADTCAAAAFDNGAGGQRVLQHLDLCSGSRPFPQHASDFPARRVAGMQHAPDAVRALRSQGRTAARVEIESRAPLEQLQRVPRPAFGEHADRVLVAETVTGGEGIARMERRRIIRTDGRRNAALGVFRVALAGIRLRDDDDVAGGSQFDGGAQAGDAAADDDVVAAKIHWCILL